MLIKRVGWTAVTKAVGVIVSLLVTVAMARLLGVNGFAEYSFLVAVSAIVSLPVSSGVSQLATREMAPALTDFDDAESRGRVAMGFVWAVFLAVLASVIYWLVLPHFSNNIFLVSVFGMTVVIVLFNGLNSVMDGVFKGVGRAELAIAGDEVLKPLFLVVLVALFFSHQDQVEARDVVGALALSTFFVFIFFFLWILKGRFFVYEDFLYSSLNFWGWFKAVIPFSVAGAVYVLGANVGVAITGLLGNQEAVSGLRVAERAVQLVSMPLLVANMVLAPHFVNRWKQSEYSELQRLVTVSSWGVFFLSFPIALFLWFFGGWVVEVLFGLGYSDISRQPMIIMLFGQIVNVAFGSVGLLLMMTGRERISLYGQLAGLIINVVLSLCLVPEYGATGAAVASACGLVVWNFILGGVVLKGMNIQPGIFSVISLRDR